MGICKSKKFKQSFGKNCQTICEDSFYKSLTEDQLKTVKDYNFDHKGALFSLNTCDGHTNVDGTKVDSVKNRMLFFNPQVIHNSTNCTDEQFRCNININYM